MFVTVFAAHTLNASKPRGDAYTRPMAHTAPTLAAAIELSDRHYIMPVSLDAVRDVIEQSGAPYGNEIWVYTLNQVSGEAEFVNLYTGHAAMTHEEAFNSHDVHIDGLHGKVQVPAFNGTLKLWASTALKIDYPTYLESVDDFCRVFGIERY